jgi:phage/plasmid-like protein (TIGR03299 family)
MITAEERQPAWSRRGSNIQGLGISEAMAKAGIDFEVGIYPLHASVPTLWTSPDEEPICMSEKVANYQLTYRKDTLTPIAPVGARYHVVQTREAVSMIEAMSLTGWSPEFGGVLRRGAAVFMAGKLDVELQTGEIDPYLCFVNSFDGSSGVKFACTPLRPHCTNQVRAIFTKRGKNTERPVVSLRHTSKVMDRVDYVASILGLTSAYYKYLDIQIDKLLNTELTGERTEQVLDVIAPLTVKGRELEGRALEGRQEKRAQVLVNLQNSKTIPNTQRSTAWGLYNSITELEQWGRDQYPTAQQSEQLLGSHLSIMPVTMTSDRVYRVMDRWLQPA